MYLYPSNNAILEQPNSFPANSLIPTHPMGVVGMPNYILPETVDYQNRVIANGGNIFSDLEINAVNYFIYQYQKNNLWSKITSCYLFVGCNGSTGSKASAQVSVKDNAYFLTYGSGVTDAFFTQIGMKSPFTGNGTNYWVSSNMPSNAQDVFNKGMSCYLASNEGGNAWWDMGTANNVANIYDYLIINNAAGVFAYAPDIGATSVQFGNFRTIQGFYSGDSIGMEFLAYKNGIPSYTMHRTQTNQDSAMIYFGSFYYTATGGSYGLTNRTYGSFCLNKGYTKDEEKIRNLIEYNFQTLLNRSVSIS